jgi:hypothetical protein
MCKTLITGPCDIERNIFSQINFLHGRMYYRTAYSHVDILLIFLKISHLKVPKCEIFERSDFHDFYSIKPFWVGDFGAKI